MPESTQRLLPSTLMSLVVAVGVGLSATIGKAAPPTKEAKQTTPASTNDPVLLIGQPMFDNRPNPETATEIRSPLHPRAASLKAILPGHIVWETSEVSLVK